MVATPEVKDAVRLAQHAASVGAHAISCGMGGRLDWAACFTVKVSILHCAMSAVVPPKQPGDLTKAVEYWTTIAG
jgi:hypothetical protein